MSCRFVVLIAASLAAASAADNPSVNVRVVEEIAAKVNGDIITRGDLEKKRTEVEAEAKRQGITGARLTEVVQEEASNALREKIDTLLLVQKGKDLSINVDGEVTRRLAEIQVQQKISDQDKFHEFLAQQTGMTFEDFKQQMRDQILTQRVIGEEVGRRISVPESDMHKYYDEHKTEFVREEQVFLSQILISTEGKTPEQVAAAEKKAKDLVARAKKGDKFSDLARDNSDETETAKNGGYVGPMKKGLMDKSIEDVVFKGKKGDITDPFKRPQGFLILKVEDRFAAGQASFEEVKEDIQNRMVQPRMEPRVRELLTRLREQAFLEIKEGYIDSGAAPGKDTRWKDVAVLKPQTTTKEEVAASRKKKLLWVIPYGTVKNTKTAPSTPSPAASPAPPPDQTPVPLPPAPPKQ